MVRIIIETLVRVVATILFVAGFSAAIFVLEQAKELYENPSSIEYFAEQIEVATGLDLKVSQVLAGALSTSLEATKKTTGDNDSTEGSAADANTDAGAGADATGDAESTVRVSYFVAWLIVILLLSLLIRIALAMAHTGGILVLHDLRARPENIEKQANNRK